ncbi:MAG: hypothetical protein HWN66_13135 [Candidatus Helarchaeota archaeon]|nr:hypothetical protein [Candidatus Helarchaeota archaeon]
MERKKWIYLGLVFIGVAVIFTIITLLIMPYAPTIFDPNDIYSIASLTTIIIAVIGYLGACACFLWWFFSGFSV